MKQLISRLKPYLRWIMFGLTLFFLAQTLKTNWGEIAEIEITQTGWICLGLALAVTLTAHIWSGWVWLLILREFNQTVRQRWGLQVYLQTNIAKYLPGNVWHFYGRILEAKKEGISLGPATISVLLEPILMASAALALALVSTQNRYWGLQAISLLAVMILVHPLILNPVVQTLTRLKFKAKTSILKSTSSDFYAASYKLERYPIKPFLGELGFVILKGIGFLLTMLALMPFHLHQIPVLLSAYSLAWLLGLVIPGAPGGLGIFEATTLALLEHDFSPGALLSAVAFYRLVSVLAETSGAVFAGIDKRWLEPH